MPVHYERVRNACTQNDTHQIQQRYTRIQVRKVSLESSNQLEGDPSHPIATVQCSLYTKSMRVILSIYSASIANLLFCAAKFSGKFCSARAARNFRGFRAEVRGARSGTSQGMSRTTGETADMCAAHVRGIYSHAPVPAVRLKCRRSGLQLALDALCALKCLGS